MHPFSELFFWEGYSGLNLCQSKYNTCLRSFKSTKSWDVNSCATIGYELNFVKELFWEKWISLQESNMRAELRTKPANASPGQVLLRRIHTSSILGNLSKVPPLTISTTSGSCQVYTAMSYAGGKLRTWTLHTFVCTCTRPPIRPLVGRDKLAPIYQLLKVVVNDTLEQVPTKKHFINKTPWTYM